VMEAGEIGTLRRIVAQPGATLAIGGLMAVLAPAEVADAEIDAFVAGFVAPEITGEDEAVADASGPRETEAGGKRLRYLDLGTGDGPPIVFVHGFGADLNTWMFNQPALAEKHRTIALDLSGHGGSTKVLDFVLDAAGFASDIDHVLAALGIGRIHLVGHSMGGAIAAAFAKSHPDRVASVTLIAPAGLGPEINGGFIDGFVKAERRREAQEVLRLLVHDPELVSRAMVEDVLRYKRLDGVTAGLGAIATEWFPNGVQDQRFDASSLSMPTQIIWGRDDRIIPVAHAEALAGRIPVHILDSTGHLPHMEKSAEVNRLIARLEG
jgi:pyruvate dehydrogenase E2 component (dihydrolipoamide acetyltransferase)